MTDKQFARNMVPNYQLSTINYLSPSFSPAKPVISIGEKHERK